jgi:hypothetical protein
MRQCPEKENIKFWISLDLRDLSQAMTLTLVTAFMELMLT